VVDRLASTSDQYDSVTDEVMRMSNEDEEEE
jgi:hypothetical protein